MPGPTAIGRRGVRAPLRLALIALPALLVVGCGPFRSAVPRPVPPDVPGTPSPVFHTPPPAPTDPAARAIPWLSAAAILARIHQADAAWRCSPAGTGLSGGGTGYHCAVAADDREYTGTLVLDLRVSGTDQVTAVYGAGMGAVPYPDGGQRDASDFLRSVLELASPPGTNLANSVPLDTTPPDAAGTPGTGVLTCRTSRTVAGQLLLAAGTCGGDWDVWETMRITMA